MTYQHPWYTAQQQLVNTTTSELESTQNLQLETTGQKHTKCKTCQAPISRGSGNKNKECSRCRGLKNRYGLNSLEVDWMYFLQEGVCANPGCSDEATVVDHNHGSGEVRQMLCHNCNTSLGLLKEDYQRMAGLIQYTQEHALQQKQEAI